MALSRFRLANCHVPTGVSGYRFGRSRHRTGLSSRSGPPTHHGIHWNCTGDRARDNLIVNNRITGSMKLGWSVQVSRISSASLKLRSKDPLHRQSPQERRQWIHVHARQSPDNRLDSRQVTQVGHKTGIFGPLPGGAVVTVVWLLTNRSADMDRIRKSLSSKSADVDASEARIFPKKNMARLGDPVTAACWLASENGCHPSQRCVRTLAQQLGPAPVVVAHLQPQCSMTH
ncbi:hypothetical protein B0J13DRAFT_523993 [Dactylonectria estremocensis]|uniref:Uncharacterized protein n=1 Tax=Dactylonectria estremocensis TaxID=1079267 RepID=A0A9P9EWY9_9HYPO|nr:hypothetical protein B0J13DRAFT_523993 [Dactylonectria estremocensis]